ncbi:MAG: hypothetical protein Mars2KO_20280 [Maribacter sp.]
MSNSINVIRQILKNLDISHTRDYIEDFILSRQDQTSLFSISDVLNNYKIENKGLQLTVDRLDELPSNCIVQVKVDNSELFYLIKNVGQTNVEFYDERNRLRKCSKSDFQSIWTGICLLIEKTRESKEVGIEKKMASKRAHRLLLGLAFILLFFSFFDTLFNAEVSEVPSSLFYVIAYAICKLIGLVIGVGLLWFEIDQHNPTLQSFCSGSGGKANCNAVLDSKYATLFRGSLNLSISALVLSYFFASLTLLFTSGFSTTVLSLLALLSLIVLPVVLVSYYYQAFVIKQWCKFCILIQVVILAETAIVFFGGFYKLDIVFENILVFLSFMIISLTIWTGVKSLFENKKDASFFKRRFSRIKNNPMVLKSLLINSREITTDTEGLGISLYENRTEYSIIKVCNPYCGPCSKAHPILEELYDEGKINLQIIFNPSENNDDPSLKPIKHLMAINSENNSLKIKQALDDWYSADRKDYVSFSSLYTMNGELEKQKSQLDAMRVWCQKENITYTPTIFINGYEFPDEYDLEDLKEIIG